MSQQHLQYNPNECIGCGACLNYCLTGCIGLDPLTITPNCIECEQCMMNCPKGEKVLRMAYNDELGGGWISPFGYQPSTNPSEGESSQDSSTESKGESQGDSSYTPADKAKLEALKNALLSAPPPPYKIQSSAKVINAIDSLKRYLSTMS